MRPQAIAKRARRLQYKPFVPRPLVQSDPSRPEGENKHDGVVEGPPVSSGVRQLSRQTIFAYASSLRYQGRGVAARYTIICGHCRVCCLTEEVCFNMASWKQILKTEAARGFLAPEILCLNP